MMRTYLKIILLIIRFKLGRCNLCTESSFSVTSGFFLEIGHTWVLAFMELKLLNEANASTGGKGFFYMGTGAILVSL